MTQNLACPKCNIAYVTTEQAASATIAGVFGALISIFAVLYMLFGSFIIGLIALACGLIIGAVGRKKETVLICPVCKRKVKL